VFKVSADLATLPHGGTFSNNLPDRLGTTFADLRRAMLSLRGEPVRLMAHAWFTEQARRNHAKWF
jgi:hypothetical protein